MDKNRLEELIESALAGARGAGVGLTGNLLKYPAAGLMYGASKLSGDNPDTTYEGALDSLNEQEDRDIVNHPTARKIGMVAGAAIPAGAAIKAGRAAGAGAEEAKQLLMDVKANKPKTIRDKEASDSYRDKVAAGERERNEAAKRKHQEEWDTTMEIKDKQIAKRDADRASRDRIAKEEAERKAEGYKPAGEAPPKPEPKEVVDRSGTRVVSKDTSRRPEDKAWWEDQDRRMNTSKRRSEYFEELQEGKPRDLERERGLDLEYRDETGRRKPATDWGSMVKKEEKPTLSFDDIDKQYNPPSDNRPKLDPEAWGNKLRETHKESNKPVGEGKFDDNWWNTGWEDVKAKALEKGNLLDRHPDPKAKSWFFEGPEQPIKPREPKLDVIDGDLTYQSLLDYIKDNNIGKKPEALSPAEVKKIMESLGKK